MPDIYDLLIDDRAERKMWAHRVSPEQLIQILSNPHVVFTNSKRGAAPFVLIGIDDGGTCITVPVVPTDDEYTWRPITAYHSSPAEQQRFEKGVS